MSNVGVPSYEIVQVNSNVIDVSTNNLSPTGLILTRSLTAPLNSTQRIIQFNSANSVGEFYGITSSEYAHALSYFGSAENLSIPKNLLIGTYVDIDRSSYVRGNKVSLGVLQLLKNLTNTGFLTCTINGEQVSVTGIDLTNVTSLLEVATILQTKIRENEKFGTLATVTYDTVNQKFTIDTKVVGVNKNMSYFVDNNNNIAYILKLREADGAVLSLGSLIKSPALNLDELYDVNKNWIGLTTIFDVTVQTDYWLFQDIAKWVNNKDFGNRFAFVALSQETNMEIAGNNNTIKGALDNYGYKNTTICYHATDKTFASKILGILASVDYTLSNAIIQVANKKTLLEQSFNATSTQEATTKFDVLTIKQVTFVAKIAANNPLDNLNLIRGGYISGPFKFIDNFYNNAIINDAFQISLIKLMSDFKKTGYDQISVSAVKSTVNDIAKKALNNGTITINKQLTTEEINIIKSQINKDISVQIYNSGYYINVQLPSRSGQANRAPLIVYFYYTNSQGFSNILFFNTFIA